MEELLGPREAARLLDALEGDPVVSVRFNPFKVLEKPRGEQVAWCRYGFYLDERPNFTLDPAFHGGAYYVQEAGSMFVEELMREAFGDDIAGQKLRILDLCASPGGKTTLLATLAGPEGLVVANEPIRSRVQPLIDNAVKWGLGNIAVTHNDPETIGALRDTFDAVLVDAPCSGEGMMRKNPKARAEWSSENVRLCAARQRRIVAEAWRTLRPGGVLIYSTCTFNRAENEENVAWMAGELGAEGLNSSRREMEGVVRGRIAGIETFRFFPHRVRSEGFFAAIMCKPQGKARPQMPRPRGLFMADTDKACTAALSSHMEQPEFMRFARIGDRFHGYYAAQYPFIKELSGRLAMLYSGVAAGELFHGRLRPDHPLAQFAGLSGDAFARAELAVNEALAYLRKGEVAVDRFAEGMNLVCCEGLPLGWAKRIGHRVNNLYPRELRILF